VEGKGTLQWGNSSTQEKVKVTTAGILMSSGIRGEKSVLKEGQIKKILVRQSVRKGVW